eukprot:CAMPEP_0178439622 /NCGR_PEP_ID=MMETSP0689_2-20121128/36262_1 /TAXON_ID=160604 /ORGANISM="Amphidinium massartii, Strain CS-259" /LENGTH=105 /DNA_ID=CAMNT_0020062179 /DNA_START=21 /DNA_END=336 /DNA_ORIENTATION=-
MNRFGMSGAESLVRRREAAVAVTSSGETLRSQVDGEHQEMGNTGGPVESMNLAAGCVAWQTAQALSTSATSTDARTRSTQQRWSIAGSAPMLPWVYRMEQPAAMW